MQQQPVRPLPMRLAQQQSSSLLLPLPSWGPTWLPWRSSWLTQKRALSALSQLPPARPRLLSIWPPG
jgi:hypothetical protein